MAQADIIPDLDQRLIADRAMVGRRIDALRSRLRREVSDLRPSRILKRNATPVLAVAVATGIVAGYASGRVVRAILHLL